MGIQNSHFLAIVLSLLCSGEISLVFPDFTYYVAISYFECLQSSRKEVIRLEKPPESICVQESAGENYSPRHHFCHKKLTGKGEKFYKSIRLDVTAPLTTVPIVNPTPTTSMPGDPTSVEEPNVNPSTEAPYASTNTLTGTPMVSSGLSWCIASQTASQAALQLALDYACGYGADCSEIQTGYSCYEPNTVRDHASYAFNSYYQKNPVPTSCNFEGTAILTNINPSTQNCQYSSTSIISSLLNTSSAWGSTVFGTVPPNTSNSALKSVNFLLSIQILTLAIYLLHGHLFTASLQAYQLGIELVILGLHEYILATDS